MLHYLVIKCDDVNIPVIFKQHVQVLTVAFLNLFYCFVRGIQTLPQAKRRLKNMLNTLEKEGYVTKDDGYQALLQAICKDVIYRKKFREFQERELKTVTRTRDIIGQLTNDLQKQLEIYDKYLDSCVMASKSPFH